MWKAAKLIMFALIFDQGQSAIDDVFRQLMEKNDGKEYSDWCPYKMKDSNRRLVKLNYDMVIDERTYKDVFRNDFKHQGVSCKTYSVVSQTAKRRKRIASVESRWPLEIPYQIDTGFGKFLFNDIEVII
ncbi:uncharacterized protein LOC127839662 [Dreissena polymorpha]|uniref:uncharacterized protein LOC127839662 n=1 Tax=Dreissena polymorpha TaxID=45954 RepID=UPI0022653489|nr:uncharacterized protein LOC127839662 [Dreissena polymorpha]